MNLEEEKHVFIEESNESDSIADLEQQVNMMEAQKKKKKKLLCWVYGVGGGIVTIGGGVFMILGGPIGLVAGGIIVGTALSSEVSII